MSRGAAQPSSFDLQGHRGCRAWYPENTLEGFRKALAQGVTTLELDVVISGDEQVVVSHEPWMSSEICSKPDGQAVEPALEKDYNLYRMTYAEIARWDCGRRGHPRFPAQSPRPATKPLLREVFEACESYRRTQGGMPVHYNIEIKSEPATDGTWHPAPERFVELLLASIPDSLAPGRITLQSFDLRPLQLLKRNACAYRLALLVDEHESPEAKLWSLGFFPDVLSPYFGLVGVELVTACHARGIRVIPWTVNDPAMVRQLIGWGVDGIITDDPPMVIDALRMTSRR